jgi:hypothetical protein
MKVITTTSASAAVWLLSLLQFADAFWRMECMSRTGLARIDPLVNFGTLSEHAHAVHGGSGMFYPSPIYKHTCIEVEVSMVRQSSTVNEHLHIVRRYSFNC